VTVPPTPEIGRWGGLLPAEPLRRVVEADLALIRAEYDSDGRYPSGLTILATRSGVSERVLYRLRHGQTRIALDLADRYCCNTNRHLSQLYPELYTEEQIAADIAATEPESAAA
jgi:hypothetical protein